MAEAGEPKRFPTRFQRKTLWTAITAVAIVVVGAIGVGAIWLGTWILSFLQPVLVPLAVAGIVAYLLNPLIGLLTKRGWSHRRAMLTVFFGFLLAIALLAVAVIVPTVGQAQEFYHDRAAIQGRVTDFFKREIDSLQKTFGLDEETYRKYYQMAVDWLTKELPQRADEVGSWVWSRLSGAFGFLAFLIGFLMVPIYLYYFLKEGRSISETWSDYLPIRASQFKDEVVATLKEINQYLISFFRGQMVVSLIDGGLVAIALLVMRLPYALLIGVFLAILGLIPYVGNLLVMIPAVLIAIAHFGATQTGSVVGSTVPEVGQVAEIVVTDGEGVDAITKSYEGVVTSVTNGGQTVEVLSNAFHWLPQVWAYPIIVIAIFLILQQINGLVTAPRIVGDSVGLHPLTVIFSVLFWALLLGGLLGALLAVPLTASVKVLFRRYIWERKLEPAVEERFGPRKKHTGVLGSAKEPKPDGRGAETGDDSGGPEAA